MDRIMLFLTNNCNLDCKYCYVKKNKLVMDYHTFINSILFLKKLSKKNSKKVITLIGGEPLLKYNLIKKMPFLCKKVFGNHNFSISISTNGILLNKEILEFMKKENIFINISIDGIGGGNKNRINSNKINSFTILEKKFQLFLKYKEIISVKFTISPDLAKDLYKNFIYFYNLGFNQFEIAPVIGVNWSNKEINSFFKNFGKIFEFAASKKIKMKGIKGLFKNINKEKECKEAKGVKELTIDTKGNIYLCPFFMALNSKERLKFSLENVNNKFFNNDKKRGNFLRNIPSCNLDKENVLPLTICKCYNLKTGKKDKKIAISNLIFERKRQKFIK